MRAGSDELRAALVRIDGRPYGHYKDLRGRPFPLREMTLRFSHVQGDPFASPSRVSIAVPPDVLDLPEAALAGADARRACADFLQRSIARALRNVIARAGSGKSGRLEIAPLGPEVLERTAVRVDEEGGAELRITVGLPAAGRRILGHEAVEVLLQRLPDALDHSLRPIDAGAVGAWIRTVEDQVALRAALVGAGLVAFLAEGSVLPRRSGADARVMEGGLPLAVPDALAVELSAPHSGRVRGLAIPTGVTLIVGGGYHGKSTLLQAIALSVYDHIPGDGRERCVARADTVCVRAEDGRAVRGVDLRPFIRDLPLGRRTDRFDSTDASGSTSQAASIVEALEAGARVLVVDEDTAASNFMIRDARMRALVPAGAEPITPYIDRVRQLWTEGGVSSLLVVGGAGDYLDVADRVIRLEAYQPDDATEASRRVAAEFPLGAAAPRPPGPWARPAPRVPLARSLDPSRGRRAERVRGVKTRAIEFGREEIDVASVYQLVDPAQARAIGDALVLLSRGLVDGERDVAALLDALDLLALSEKCERGMGDRAAPRRFEIAAALNRLRSLRLVGDDVAEREAREDTANRDAGARTRRRDRGRPESRR